MKNRGFHPLYPHQASPWNHQASPWKKKKFGGCDLYVTGPPPRALNRGSAPGRAAGLMTCYDLR